MRNFIVKLNLILTLGATLGCQTGYVPVSSRNIAGIEKPGSLHGNARGVDPSIARPQLYVKNKVQTIEPTDPENTTGSLFNSEDQRSYLFLNNAPLAVGQFVDVKVVSTRAATPETPAGQGAATNDESSGDAAVKDMLAALPQLTPGDENGAKLVSKLKMQVVHIYENGDVRAIVKRVSQKENEGNEITATARIPYASQISGNGLSTNDLVDVHWQESLDGQLTESYSSIWEDEYSLRFSGFDEAKSKYAIELDDKRKQLESVKDRLKNQLISVGKERQTIAKERERLLNEKAQDEQKLTTLSDESEKLKATIEEQRSAIEEEKAKVAELELSGEEQASADATAEGKPAAAKAPAKKPQKPGDSKDAVKGKK